MKKLLALTVILYCLLSATSQAQVQWRNAYTRRDGNYVQGYYQNRQDSSVWNNYSTKGNVNPFTGQRGSVDPYRAPSLGNSYSSRRSYGGYSSRGGY